MGPTPAARTDQDGVMDDLRALLHETADRIADHRAGSDGAVHPNVSLDSLRSALGGPLPIEPSPAARVVAQLAAGVENGIVATTGPRYFGFVIGGALDAATCADLLTVGWDQPAFNTVTSPAAAVAEDVSGTWLKELLQLPATASFGLVTGGQGANTVGLAAARHHVYSRVGWDVEADGLIGAPPLRVVASEERHATIDRSLRLLGFGAALVEAPRADHNGAVDVDDLGRVLAEGDRDVPTIVCLQSGNVNTGACDDLAAACRLAHDHGPNMWVHVDGAFGLWAAASPRLRHLVAGIEQADSWATDGHKWLNVPYDCGYVFCAHPDAHRAAMSFTAAYLTGHGSDGARAPSDFVPESSRRARGFATWAALRELGASGVADLVDRCCALAARFAEQLAAVDGVTIGNDVMLNQVLVHFGDDERTDRVVAAVQREGTCWMGATTWQGRRYMRISVSSWATTEADVDRSVAAITRVLATN
jgi:glutamate/tyrosine decarboxylase-like PLP-dependent enzyme